MKEESPRMDPTFLEILACPVCKESLRWEEEPALLVCERCRKA